MKYQDILDKLKTLDMIFFYRGGISSAIINLGQTLSCRRDGKVKTDYQYSHVGMVIRPEHFDHPRKILINCIFGNPRLYLNQIMQPEILMVYFLKECSCESWTKL